MLKKVKDWIGPSLDVYKVENANDVGVGLCRHIWQGEKDATQIGTTLNAEIMNNLQNSLVHTITATKNAGSGVEYYVCNLDGLNEFGLNKDLKLRINVDYENTNTTTKLRLNNNDYTLLKEQNGTLKQIEAGDIHRNKTYELIYNGSQFVIINLFKNFESAYLDNYVKTTDLAQENKAGVVTLSKVKESVPAATNDTNGTINLKQINDMIDIRVPSATNNIAGKVMLGTTKNTALEGNRLAEILGLEFGGNIQDSGSKIKGKFYYDSVTKFYYECLENTNLTYNDSGKFRAISNKPILDKLENCVKKTDLASENEAGVVTLSKIREIAPKVDLTAIQSKVDEAWGKANDAQVYRIYEIRLAGMVYGLIFQKDEAGERNGYVVTGIENFNADRIIDRVSLRALQFFRNGQWINAYFA